MKNHSAMKKHIAIKKHSGTQTTKNVTPTQAYISTLAGAHRGGIVTTGKLTLLPTLLRFSENRANGDAYIFDIPLQDIQSVSVCWSTGWAGMPLAKSSIEVVTKQLQQKYLVADCNEWITAIQQAQANLNLIELTL